MQQADTKDYYQRSTSKHILQSKLCQIEECFKHHPPNSFGTTIFCHFTKGNLLFSLSPDQKTLKFILLILSKMPLGVKVKYIQFTEIAANSDFTKINLLRLDNHLLHPTDKLLSTLAIIPGSNILYNHLSTQRVLDTSIHHSV